jgi:protein gp37
MREERVSDIQCACRKADTACFFKQWGGKLTGRVYRGRTCDEMPQPVA